MKHLALLTILLTGCASMTQQQRADITALADLAIETAATRYGVPPTSTKAIEAGANSLFGIAAQAQANVGSTPTAANIAQGSAVPGVGAAVQAALPANSPITQAQVDQLFKAASAAANNR